MIIKVLGKGCKNCDRLAKNARQAVEGLGLVASIEKVTDIDTIVEHGVMRTPALVIDDTVMCQSKIPSVDDIKKMLV